jgi:hypothetical protein
VAPTNPAIAGTASPSLVVAGTSTLLTATVTPGTNPVSTGLTVNGDLSTIGGGPVQAFYNDGTHGDVTSGDNIFSFTATVTAGTSAGSKSLPVTVNDAQARSGNGTITLSVTPAPTNPTISGTATPSSVVAGTLTLLTATVTPGANPTSSGTTVTCDLSTIGGGSTQSFYDDGTHGDVASGDNIFSFTVMVTAGTSAGSKSLPIAVHDAQARTGSGTISLTVTIAPTNPTITGTASPSSVVAGTSTLLTSTVTPGANPTSTGLTVTGDLSTIGGGSTQSFFNDGTHGDVTSGDSIFSFSATVTIGTSAGLKSLPITVNDAQARTGNGTISLTVTPAPTNPTIIGAALPSSVVAGNTTWLTTTVVPGANPASTGITVSGDLSAIGGSAAQIFYDDATHGDVTAGDNVFSLTATVTVGTSLGSKNILVTATDNQLRTGSGIIAINVTTAPTNPLIDGNATPSSVLAGNSTLLAASVTPGTNPASTSIVVEGDLSAIGGSPTQLFYDDGSHGDITASDNIFSYNVIVSGGTSAGIKSLPITVTDEQLRSGNDTITLTVTTITCPTITLLPSQLPTDTLGRSYSQIVAANGGVSPYVYSISSGYLPDGIDLSSSGIISGSPTKVGTFSFTIMVHDSNYCTGSQFYSIQIFDSTMIVNTNYTGEWNLISLPVYDPSASLSTIFPDAVSEAFAYGASGYQSISQLEYGRGYWLKFGAAHIQHFVGEPLLNDTINVVAGWNLIGSLSSCIPSTAIIPIGTTLQSGIFCFNGAYSNVDSLTPGKGYWVKVSTDGQLVMTQIPSLAQPTTDHANVNNTLPTLNRLEFVNAQGTTGTLYFGGEKDYDNKLFVLPPVPPTGCFDVRFASQRFVETYNAALNNPIEFPISVSWVTTSTTIRWSMNGSQENLVTLRLIKGKTVKEISLEGAGSTTCAIDEQSHVILTIAGKSNQPATFTLYPNHPNPFNPTTLIGYDLPAPSYVVLTVYNLLGQEVTQLVNGIESTGGKTVEWTAQDVPSGIYFYKITAVQLDAEHKTFSQVRKMILMK